MSREALLRRKRRWMMIYFAILLIVIPVLIGLLIMIFEGIDVERVSMVYLPLTLLVAIYAGMGLWKGYKMEVPTYRLVEVLKCTQCGFEDITDPTPGDYINMEKGKCPRCGGSMKVSLIYKERVKS